MQTLQVRAIKFNGYKIELTINIRNQPVARLSKFITAGSNKGTWKLQYGFYFNDEAKREVWVKAQINNIKKSVKIKAERKANKNNARKNLVNPYKIGHVFYDSWGYEQTNIDFFQVVEVKEKNVVIRKIGQNVVENSVGFMCENVTPDVDNFIGKPVTKVLQVRLCSNNQVEVYVSASRGGLFNYDGGEKGLYQSHYA